MSEKLVRTKYTPEFRLETVLQVKAGQSISAIARVPGILKASLGNLVRASEKGELRAVSDKGTPVAVILPRFHIRQIAVLAQHRPQQPDFFFLGRRGTLSWRAIVE